ncbi:hypothetical protein BZL35_00183 [Candidatus Pandoraea novymonadis]|uniref:Uncharacterized protein n=1 Tax=Candidatus Pandoraea novymonadis TaxID=1808959 RepID=A0ABX5FE64_9BURK|nr:hypothetical protein BZL35_00183 [Candidatus Pandoraea novymonadis]
MNNDGYSRNFHFLYTFQLLILFLDRVSWDMLVCFDKLIPFDYESLKAQCSILEYKIKRFFTWKAYVDID